jgi:phosphoglycerate dehydrogenase-like enzyme
VARPNIRLPGRDEARLPPCEHLAREVVDEAALLAALDASRVRSGLDVFADEPASGSAEWESPLAKHPGVVATHRIGASTEQAQTAIAAGVVEIVDAFAPARRATASTSLRAAWAAPR